MATNLDQIVNITYLTKLYKFLSLHICFDISSVEQTSTKGISLKFPPMTSVPSTDKSKLVETPLATITEHVQVQNTTAPFMYVVPVSNIALNQQQAEVTQIAPEPLSATPTLQETLKKMMPRMTEMEMPCLKCRQMYPICTTFNSPIFLYRNYEIINESYYCVRHKNRRKHNQHFKTAVFHNKFTLRHIKPSIYI